jgi:hypothetical protein
MKFGYVMYHPNLLVHYKVRMVFCVIGYSV